MLLLSTILLTGCVVEATTVTVPTQCYLVHSIGVHATPTDYYANVAMCGQFLNEIDCEAVWNEDFCIWGE